MGSSYSQPRDVKGKKALLGSGGSFNPVHASHVQMMHTAKEKIESEGYIVDGAYLICAYDEHVQAKCQTAALDLKTRVELCNIASKDEGFADWLFADGPEASAFRYLRNKKIEKFGEDEDVLLVIVMGEDLWRRVGSHNSEEFCTLIVPRPSQPDPFGRTLDKYPENPHNILPPPSHHRVSSTLLRVDYFQREEEGVRRAVREGLITRGVGEVLIDKGYHKILAKDREKEEER